VPPSGGAAALSTGADLATLCSAVVPGVRASSVVQPPPRVETACKKNSPVPDNVTALGELSFAIECSFRATSQQWHVTSNSGVSTYITREGEITIPGCLRATLSFESV
jgi:hypothetical protein